MGWKGSQQGDGWRAFREAQLQPMLRPLGQAGSGIRTLAGSSWPGPGLAMWR